MTNPSNEPRQELTFIEPIGGGGRQFDDRSHRIEHGPLRRLLVCSGDIVDDVIAVYGSAEIRHVEGDSGRHPIELSDDPLVGISGWYGDYYGADHFRELTFHTASGESYGPFGGGKGEGAKPFELRVPKGHVVAALLGNTLQHSDGTEFLSALGLWTMPQSEPSPQPTPAAARVDDAPLLPGYRSDSVDRAATDLLGIQRDVDALCMVIASKLVSPPLSVGLFGDWGSGKSFFMAKLRARVDELARHSDKSSAFCRDVVHVEFNAWHFADANLWASLVTNIYDELYAHIGGTTDEDKLRESFKAQLDLAEGAKKAALEDLQRAETELTQAKLARAEAEKKYDSYVDDMKALLAADPNIERSVDAAGKALGAPKIAGSYDTLAETAQALRSLTTRGAAVGRMLLGSPLTKIAIPTLVITLAVPALVHLLLQRHPGMVGSLDAFAAKLGAALSAGALWLSAQIKRASEHVATIETAYEEARAQRDKRKKAAQNDPQFKMYEAALAKEAAARKAMEDMRARAQDLERQLAEHDPRRRMERLITSRATGDDYRKHLGIVSAIRKDFEVMSRALAAPTAGADGKAAPGAMRIILYIDDLDRCRPDRVAEILEAVHLLLAFPLFVVVVGVDPRWLRRCLQAHYPELLGEVSSKPGARASTPQDYLEKIFQIPYALRRMNGLSFATLMSDLLGPAATPYMVPAEAAASKANRASPAAGATPTPTSAPSNKEAAKSDGDARHPPAEVVPGPIGDIAVLLRSSRQLELTADEHRDIRELGRLFRGPRSVKRFVNIYRLIRARVEPEELGRFLKEKHYRAALVLLAVVTAYPNQASRFLLRLRWWLPKRLERGALSSWDDFMMTLERSREELEELDGLPLAELDRRLAELGAPLNDHEDSDWRAMGQDLRAVLAGMSVLFHDMRMPFTEDVLERWSREVSRYSFSFALAEVD